MVENYVKYDVYNMLRKGSIFDFPQLKTETENLFKISASSLVRKLIVINLSTGN